MKRLDVFLRKKIDSRTQQKTSASYFPVTTRRIDLEAEVWTQVTRVTDSCTQLDASTSPRGQAVNPSWLPIQKRERRHSPYLPNLARVCFINAFQLRKRVPQGLKRLCENWVVPPGLGSSFPLYPPLKRWAKLGRPSGAGIADASFHRVNQKQVLTHALRPVFLNRHG